MLSAFFIALIGYIIGIVIVLFSGRLIVSLAIKHRLSYPVAKRLLVIDFALMLVVPAIAGSYFLLHISSWMGKVLAGIWILLLLGTLINKNLSRDAEHTLNIRSR